MFELHVLHKCRNILSIPGGSTRTLDFPYKRERFRSIVDPIPMQLLRKQSRYNEKQKSELRETFDSSSSSFSVKNYKLNLV